MFFKAVIENTVILAILTQGWCLKPMREYVADLGQNLTLPCLNVDSDLTEQTSGVMWVRDGREQVNRLSIQHDGSLVLTELSRSDSGLYTCILDNDNTAPGGDDLLDNAVKVRVRTPPPPLVNVTVHPSTILALVLWNVESSGGYPIIDFTAEYRLYRTANGSYAPSDEEWKIISPAHISPNSRQIDVYHLEPNSTYAFRVWGTNSLGPGEKVEVLGHTLYSDEDMELARHLLAGVETFDTRVWVIAVAVVMGTLVVLTTGTCIVLYRECRDPTVDDGCTQETMELVPNITLNPGYKDNTTTIDNNIKDTYAFAKNESAVKTIINNESNMKQLSNGFAKSIKHDGGGFKFDEKPRKV